MEFTPFARALFGPAQGALGAIVVRDGVALHLTKLDDETWKTRSDFTARPIKSGEEYRAKGAIHPKSVLKEPDGYLLTFFECART